MKQEEQEAVAAAAAAAGQTQSNVGLEYFQEVSHARAAAQLREVLALLDGARWQDVPFVAVEFARRRRAREAVDAQMHGDGDFFSFSRSPMGMHHLPEYGYG